MLSGISILCFAASYALALALEMARFFRRRGIPVALRAGVAAAGLLAHFAFLAARVSERNESGATLATWYFGCLLLSWLLAVVYLIGVFVAKRSAMGLLLLPTALALIAAAHLFPQASGSVRTWTVLHGLALAAGMAMVVLGFVAGVMYLIQSYRLKHKLPARSPVWIPSLEKLERWNEQSLLASIALLALGLVSGILMNLIRVGAEATVPWNDPLVLVSLLWLIWMLVVLLFNGMYPASRRGRKVAYLTVGSFVFLALIIAVLVFSPSQHGQLPMATDMRQTSPSRGTPP